MKLINASKDAEVYIDNAYAGKAGDLKRISIKPGAYNLELRVVGKEPIQRRVYVLSGKTLKLEF
ncbi:MAG: PEGA domain-containing protein [Terriglobales bacterium]